MILSLLRKRYNIPIVSFLLCSFLTGGFLHASPPGSPAGNPSVVSRPPVRVGDRLYFTPACPIIAENFNEAADVNGATSDPSSVGWYLDASKVPNAVYFSIKSHRIKAQTLGGEGVWYSQVYNISGYTGIQVDTKISSEGSFTSSEYVKVSYKLNGGPETLIGTYTGAFGTPMVTSPQMTGSTVQLVIRLYNVSVGNNDYYIEQYDVFKEVGPCSVSGISVSAAASNPTLTCANASTTLTASTTATGTTTYSWSGPSGFTATGSSVTATAAGTYTVTGTNSAGTGTATVTVASNTAAPSNLTATASGILTCAVSGVTLTASSSESDATYAWTGPNNYTATGASVTANMAGTYTVTAKNPTTGCTSSTSINVVSNTTPPAGVTASNNGPLTCNTTSVTLTGSSSTSGTTFAWTGPNSFTASGATATTVKPGAYTVTATNPSTGCTATATTTVTSDFTVPANVTVSNTGPLTCATTSVTLNATSSTTSGVTYEWGGPGGFVANGPSVTTTVPGLYSFMAIYTATGCTIVSQTIVAQNTTAPAGVTATVSGPLSCSSPSVTLTGASTTSGTTFAWSGPGGFTATGATATATTAGTYTLTATNPATGCMATASTTVTGNTTAPAGLAIAAANNVTQLTCSTNFTTLSGSSTTPGVTYSWSGPNNFTATSSAVNVFNAGTYTMTVTNPTSGCTANASIVITQNITAPAGVVVTPSATQLTCSNPSATLTGASTTSGVSYAWAGPSSFTATGTTVTAVLPGQYTLTVTDPTNGCTTSTASTVTANFAPPAGVTAINNGPVTCANTSVTLTANSTTSNVSYNWAGPSGYSASTAAATTTAGGTYTLTVTNPVNGCTAIATTVVATDTTRPAALTITSIPAASVLTCVNNSVALTASSTTTGTTYAWANASGQGLGSGTSLTVGSAGTYTVTATYPANGCSAILSSIVTQNITAPGGVTTTANPATAQITCAHTSVLLTGASSTPNVSFGWSGPNGFSATGATTTATDSGVYTLTVTDPTNGCVSRLAGTVTKNKSVPVGLSAGPSDVISCITTAVDLQGSSTTPNVTFSWTGPNGYTANTAVAETDAPGPYTLTVTNPANGCTAAIGTTVVADTATPTGVTASNNGPLTCTVKTVTLTSSSTTPTQDFLWVTPGSTFIAGQTVTVSSPGTYTVIVTDDDNGCSSQATTTVVQNTTGCSGSTVFTSGASTAKGSTLSDVTATVDSVSGFVYKAYPNPFQSTAFVTFESPVSTAVSVELYNGSGYREKLLFNGNVDANQTYKVMLSADGLSSGAHFCIIRTVDKVYSIKLLLIK